jgi:hypothetical protein
MFVSPLTQEEELALKPHRLALIESMSADKAPSIRIDVDPEGPDESFEIVFLREEPLARFKAFLLAEMSRSAQLLESNVAAGISSPYHAPSTCPSTQS